jgi:hypothetical protein
LKKALRVDTGARAFWRLQAVHMTAEGRPLAEKVRVARQLNSGKVFRFFLDTGFLSSEIERR